MLSGSIVLAVLFHKELQTSPPAGLKIASVSERADPSDLLVIRKDAVAPDQKWSLKQHAIVGTSSARRKSQVISHRDDVELKDLRGNVPTRIDKLRSGNYDAILLAKAGIDRLELDMSEFTCVALDPSEFVPAPAQGVLGLQIRENDSETEKVLSPLNHEGIALRIGLERKILNLLDGGCQLPLGAFCTPDHLLHVAFAPMAGEKSTYLTFKVDQFEGMAETVVAQLNNATIG